MTETETSVVLEVHSSRIGVTSEISEDEEKNDG
jgi:hypothetical protein